MAPDTENQDERKFLKTLDKYYTEIDDAEQKLSDDQNGFQERLQSKTDERLRSTLHQTSSFYYEKSQQRFDEEIKKFEKKISDSLSGYRSYYSDLKFSDGYQSISRHTRSRYNKDDDSKNSS